MDEELQNLEIELAALRPVPVSQDLTVRLGRELDPGRAVIPGWGWFGLAAAAAVALVALPVRSVQAGPKFKPIAAQDVLYAARDEGYVQLGDGTPAHRLREFHVDTITWENPQNHASLRWSVPRDEVRVIPASFQ